MRSSQFVLFCSICYLLVAQASAKSSKKEQPQGQRETVAKPLTDKQKKKQEEKLRKELETPYKKWLNEEVVYIISDEERKAFRGLATDEERQQFIEQFWLRRDPTPDTEENEFREEHYRRIAYSNERFAPGIPAWKTDRGRMYIAYGPPDEVEPHPPAGTYDRPYDEGAGGFHPGNRLFRADEHHGAVRYQGPPVQAEGRRVDRDGEHLRPDHDHVPAAGEPV